MDVRQNVRDRLKNDDVPQQVYALVGASLLVRDRLTEVPGAARSRVGALLAARDRWVTTAYQRGFEARERVEALPSDLSQAARSRFSQALAVPALLRRDVAERVIDLRGEVADQYVEFSASGQRALTHWHTERVLNERAASAARSVTPGLARATVATRDAAARAAASPTARRAGEAGRRAGQSAKRAFEQYLAAIDEAAATPVGEYPATPGSAAPGESASAGRR